MLACYEICEQWRQLGSGLIIYWLNAKQSWFCLDAPESSQRLHGYVGMFGTAMTIVGLMLNIYQHGW